MLEIFVTTCKLLYLLQSTSPSISTLSSSINIYSTSSPSSSSSSSKRTSSGSMPSMACRSSPMVVSQVRGAATATALLDDLPVGLADPSPAQMMGMGAQMMGLPPCCCCCSCSLLLLMESITSHLCSSRRHALILPSKARLLIYTLFKLMFLLLMMMLLLSRRHDIYRLIATSNSSA